MSGPAVTADNPEDLTVIYRTIQQSAKMDRLIYHKPQAIQERKILIRAIANPAGEGDIVTSQLESTAVS